MESKKSIISKYISYQRNLYDLKLNLDILNVNIEDIDLFIKDNFSEIEKYIFIEHYVKQKTLNTIATEINYSYSYTRQIATKCKNKIDIFIYIKKDYSEE